MACMVVTEEDKVEAGNFAGYLQRCVFFVLGSLDAAFLAAMEEADDDIGLLVLLDVGHPLARTCHHVVEA